MCRATYQRQIERSSQKRPCDMQRRIQCPASPVACFVAKSGMYDLCGQGGVWYFYRDGDSTLVGDYYFVILRAAVVMPRVKKLTQPSAWRSGKTVGSLG